MLDVINVVKSPAALYVITVVTLTDIVSAFFRTDVSFSGFRAPENLVGYLLGEVF